MNTKRFSLAITVLVVIVAAVLGVAGLNSARAATVCSPATAISVPYAKDGVGDICVVATSLCSYINSWNLTTLEVNGTSYLNTYVAASSVAPLNGSYTIHYVSTVAWGHFEIAGTCGAPQPTATTPPATIPPTTGPTATRTSTPTIGPSLTPTTGPSLTPTKTNTPIIPTVTPVSGSTLSINAGGSATGSFLADQYYSGGTAYTNTNTIDISQVGSVPAAVFQSERYGAFSYTIPNRSGAQTVTLYFAETYLTAAGQRLFNVSINGATVLSSFDIYASAGGQNKAIGKTFNTTANSSGQVVIQLTTGTENPKINGISVTGSGSTPTTGPSLTATRTLTPGTGPTATPTRTATAPAVVGWPTSQGADQPVTAPIAVTGTFDGGMKRYYGSGALGTGGQDENQKPLFDLAAGATLKNVILGNPAADGVHCAGACTLQNVWWEDVGEDAATFRGSSSSLTFFVTGGGARHASDKIFQHNGAGTLTISNFQASDFGKLYRSCGNCSTQYKRNVVIQNVTLTAPGSAVAGINTNYGDTARFLSITIIGNSSMKVCNKYTGNNTGAEPTLIGSGADGVNCIYSASDIIYK